MIEAASLVTFLWLLGWALYSSRALAFGDERSVHFVLLVFFLFCGMPLAADLVFGTPEYGRQPNYYRVSRDDATCLIYCLWMAAVPPLCLLVPPARQQRGQTMRAGVQRSVSPWVRVLMYAFVASPLALVLVAPDPGRYGTYAVFLLGEGNAAELEFHHYLAAVCLLVALAVPTMMIVIPRLSAVDWTVFVAALVEVAWLHGKRSIMAISVLGLMYALWKRGTLRGVRLGAAAVAALSAVILSTVLYQSSVRGMSFRDNSFYYDTARVDFGRDAVIKQAIYAELHPESAILDYRGQSLLFSATFFVPRDLWPDKPWPYAVYATAAMLERAVAEDIGWGITTSILDEFLANFGWAGAVAAPLLLSYLCRLGDGSGSSLPKALTVIIGALFLVVHLSAFMTPFLVWLLVMIVSWRRGRRPVVKRLRMEASPAVRICR